MNKVTENWHLAKKPFDMMKCGNCLSMHTGPAFCTVPEHQIVRDAARKAGLLSPSNGKDEFQKQLPVFKRLRKTFAHFYPKETT